MREQNDNLCYCKPGFTGHVHAARTTPEEWAQGVLAIDFLGRNSMATSTPKLTAKNQVDHAPRHLKAAGCEGR